MIWLTKVLIWLVTHWKLLVSSGLLAGIGGLVKFWYSLREARARTLKAESELCALKKQEKRENEDSHIKELSLLIRQYADTIKEGKLKDRLFQERELAIVLENEKDKLPQVLEYLRKEEHAKKSWSGYWRIT